MSPGLANKICLSSATKICCNFPETLSQLPDGKALLTGSPIRSELLSGNALAALDFCGFTANKPVLLVIGGSTGSVIVNNAVREALPILTEQFQIIHLCGQGKMDPAYDHTPGYVQYEYIKKELADMFAAADVVISRAGANAICELLALKKPNILIPLSANASRGDQILNAGSFEKQGFSTVLSEEELTTEHLVDAVNHTYQNRQTYIDAMSKSEMSDAITKITDLLDELAVSHS